MCKFGDFVLYFEVVKSSLLLHLQAPYSLFCASHAVESTLWGQTGHKPLACITLACQWYLPPVFPGALTAFKEGFLVCFFVFCFLLLVIFLKFHYQNHMCQVFIIKHPYP